MKAAALLFLVVCSCHANALDASLLKNVEAARDHEFLAKLMADSAASSEARGNSLRQAAYSGFPDSVDWLLSGPAATAASSADKDGFTALMATFLHPKYLPTEYAIVRKLLDKGADANMRNANGSTALMLFIESRGENVLFGNPLDCEPGEDGSGLIPWGPPALFEYEAATFALLLRASADINWKDQDGRSALVLATERRLPAMMRGLLEAGADPNVEIAEFPGKTPIFFAAPELVRLLVERGADPNGADANGDTPLHGAMQSRIRNTIELRSYVKAMLAAGARDLPNKKGEYASDTVSPYGICNGPVRATWSEVKAAIRAARQP